MNKSAAVISIGIISGVALSGCRAYDDWRHPEVVACDDYVIGSLKAPSTYKRLKTTISDSRLPFEYWQEDSRSTFSRINSKELMQLTGEVDRQRAKEGGVRTVLIEYDADNGFGVPVRGLSMCRFEMSSTDNNEFTQKPSASAAKLAVMTAQITGEESATGCCESKETSARLDKYRKNEQYLSQQVLN